MKGKKGSRKDRFPYEYIIDLNATQAAIRCGCSPKSARTLGARLFANVEVKAKIKELQTSQNKRALKTADEVEELLDKCLFAVPKEYVNEVGIAKGLHELTADQSYAIDNIETWHKENADGTGMYGGTKLSLIPKHQLFNLKMKRLGLLVDRHELKIEQHTRFTFGKKPVEKKKVAS